MIFLFWEHILFTERISLYSYISCACAHNANLASQKQYFGKKLNPIEINNPYGEGDNSLNPPASSRELLLT